MHNTRNRRGIGGKELLIQSRLTTEATNNKLQIEIPFHQTSVLQILQGKSSIFDGDRTHVEYHILQDFNHHTTETRDSDGTEGSIAIGTNHHFKSLRDHFAYHDTMIVNSLLAELFMHLVDDRASRFSILDVQGNTTHISLVNNLE